MTAQNIGSVRHDWTKQEILDLFEQPFMDLLYTAQTVHRQNFPANAVQQSTLLSIKTGACPEDCKYCSQSGHYKTKLEKEKLLAVANVVEKAKQAKQQGASRFCMGAAWRGPRERDLDVVLEMVKQVKALGLETCMTLGMLTDEQAQKLSEAGLDYYNHNLDTSPEYYDKVITTRTYQDRLDTLENVRNSGMKVCSGGILGMGEKREDRVSMLQQFANLPKHPESVPINMLIPIEGTPLANADPIDHFEFVRSIAVARIVMPKSFVRLSAGRTSMSKEIQTLCYFAGANSIFLGEQLLTTDNPDVDFDQALFAELGIKPLEIKEPAGECV